jgi:hypothetical protein
MEPDDCPHGATKATCEWCGDDEQDERDAIAVLDRNVKRFFVMALAACAVALAALVGVFLVR